MDAYSGDLRDEYRVMFHRENRGFKTDLSMARSVRPRFHIQNAVDDPSSASISKEKIRDACRGQQYAEKRFVPALDRLCASAIRLDSP